MTKKKKVLCYVVGTLLSLCILCGLTVLGTNIAVKASAKGQILSSQEAAQLQDVDCILVLGCGVRDDGTPSAMLEDRLKRALELYRMGASAKLLMSGDHGEVDYDEVATMKAFAVNAGIASEDIFMDHAGFSTYESMYRAKEIFQVRKVIIVTQAYHLHRAIYIAQKLGLEAYGVAADYRSYSGQSSRDVREVLARTKDFITCLFKPEPTYLGETIPIWGNGNLTNDENQDFT